MISLSAVIITYNEEKNIGRCLASLKDVADDIVVVDSFSNDKTGEIVSSFGGRFVQHSFEGHIQQKNWAITQAKFPYCLSLDADEELSEELKRSIFEAKKNWQFDGYRMNRLTNYCGQWIKHSGWYPDTKLRLWDSRKGKWGGINPHDKFEMATGEPTGFLNGDLLHYSYYTVEEHYRQAEKFSTIAARALFDKGKRSNLLKRIIKTSAKFIRNYFLKLGFLDGRSGFTICRITAWETWEKYKKLQHLGEGKLI